MRRNVREHALILLRWTARLWAILVIPGFALAAMVRRVPDNAVGVLAAPSRTGHTLSHWL
jgi:hypothetical protein